MCCIIDRCPTPRPPKAKAVYLGVKGPSPPPPTTPQAKAAFLAVRGYPLPCGDLDVVRRLLGGLFCQLHTTLHEVLKRLALPKVGPCMRCSRGWPCLR